jgi:predicted nicotinamide N-methyase
MDIRTLPDRERVAYNNLNKLYSLHFESLKIADYNIRILKPSDMEELLNGQDQFSDMSTFPFWAKLWESSIVLAHLLVSVPPKGGKRLLELGAGLGLSGIAASAAGFDVVLTDNKQLVLDFQQVSAAANGDESIKHLLFDWILPAEIGSFDVIGGAEILSNEEFLDPLLDICKNYLADGGTIYLAHDVRRKCLPIFLEKAERDFHVGSRKQSIRRADATVDILVNRLQRK